jgi:hypothetical protein
VKLGVLSKKCIQEHIKDADLRREINNRKQYSKEIIWRAREVGLEFTRAQVKQLEDAINDKANR